MSFPGKQGVYDWLRTRAGDAAWLARYALSREGARVPWALVEKSLRATHPYAVFAVRSMLSVPVFEKALYELPEVRSPTQNVLVNMLLRKEYLASAASPV